MGSVLKKNSSPCAGTRLDGMKVKSDGFPTGVVHGAELQPNIYKGTMLDYIWEKYNIPMISAHISCCNFPKSRNLLQLYKENLPPILKFLELVYQGVWGKVTDSDNNPISNVTINIGGKLEVTDMDGMFMTVYPEGKHKMELVHKSYQTKNMQFTIEKSRMARKDIVMDSLAPSLSYHTMEQVKTSLNSLVSQYPNYAMMYDHLDLECIKITDDIPSEKMKPVIRVLGWGSVGVEVSLALAQYLVTRIGKDDMVTDITTEYEVHVLFGKNSSSMATSSNIPCPATNTMRDIKLGKARDEWSNTVSGKREIFGLDFVSGSGAIQGRGSTEYRHMLVGDTSQCQSGQTVDDEITVSGNSAGMIVGLSCCDKPAALGSIWAAHSRAVLTAISNLEGVHGELVDSSGDIVVGSLDKLAVNQSELAIELDSGHFWVLLPTGQHTLSVGKVTIDLAWPKMTGNAADLKFGVTITPDRKVVTKFGWEWAGVKKVYLDVVGNNPWIGDYKLSRQGEFEEVSGSLYKIKWTGHGETTKGFLRRVSPVETNVVASVNTRNMKVDAIVWKSFAGQKYGFTLTNEKFTLLAGNH